MSEPTRRNFLLRYAAMALAAAGGLAGARPASASDPEPNEVYGPPPVAPPRPTPTPTFTRPIRVLYGPPAAPQQPTPPAPVYGPPPKI